MKCLFIYPRQENFGMASGLVVVLIFLLHSSGGVLSVNCRYLRCWDDINISWLR